MIFVELSRQNGLVTGHELKVVAGTSFSPFSIFL